MQVKNLDCDVVPSSQLREQTERVIRRQSRCLHVLLQLEIQGGGGALWKVDIPVFGFQIEPGLGEWLPFLLNEVERRVAET